MKVIYSKNTYNRSKNYKVVTKILQDDNKKIVTKEAIFPEGEEHIIKIANNYSLLTQVYSDKNICKSKLENKTLYFDFIDGISLNSQLIDILQKKDISQLNNFLEKYISIIKHSSDNVVQFQYTEGFKKVFGDIPSLEGMPSLKISNIDLLPSNIILTKDSYCIIDYEWCYDFPIPIDIILYRCLYSIYFVNIAYFENFISFYTFLDLGGIKHSKQLENAHNNFYKMVFEDNGIDLRYLYAKFLKPTNDNGKQTLDNICIFLANDFAFQEENSFKINQNNNLFSFEFQNICSQFNSIRLDFGEHPTIVSIDKIEVLDKDRNKIWRWNGDINEFYETNHIEIVASNKLVLFTGNDPFVVLPKFANNTELGSIVIDARSINGHEITDSILSLSKSMIEMGNLLKQKSNIIKDQSMLLELKNNEIKIYNNDIEYLTHQINAIKSSRKYRSIELLTKIINKLLPRGTKRRKALKLLFYKPLKLSFNVAVNIYRFGLMATAKKIFNKIKGHIKTCQINRKQLKNKLVEQAEVNQFELNQQRLYKFNKDIKISIITPLYNTDSKMLKEMIISCIEQTYNNWELCLADGSDDNHNYIKNICDDYCKKDTRIKYTKLDKNYGISENTNIAVKLSSGEYLSLLDHDDVLHPSALFEIMLEIEKGSDFIYTDEALFSKTISEPYHIYYKPNFSPNLLLSQNYITHLISFKRTLLADEKLFRSEYDGSQDYDLILRLSLGAKKVAHIPAVLYFWRMHSESTSQNPSSKLYADDAGANAIKSYLDERNLDADIERPNLFQYAVKFKIKNDIKVSIIIPMKDKWEITDSCVKSIISKSSYQNYELIILNNNSIEESTINWISYIVKYDNRIKVIDANFEFNWSKLNNFGIKNSSGEIFIFLNNDTEVITEDWIERISGYAIQDDIGIVGALLLYPDNTIQHAGVVIGMNGYADHIYKNDKLNQATPYYFTNPSLIRNVIAVTGACMAVSRKTLEKIGLFDEEFIICGSDVEICLRAYKNGLYNVCNSTAILYHYESKSRGSFIPDIDFQKSLKAYAPYLNGNDPFYNKNLPLNIEFGQKENNKQINIKYEPVPNFMPSLNHIKVKADSVKNPDYRITLFIPSLNSEHVFGGISTAISFAKRLSANYKLRLATTDTRHSDEIEKKYSEYEILSLNNRQSIMDVHQNDIFIATAWWSAYILADVMRFQQKNFNKSHNLIYFIQDYEPGFYPWSSSYILADSTYKNNVKVTAIFNSKLLHDYFINNNYDFDKKYYFDPVMNSELCLFLTDKNKRKRKKQILIYGRPTVSRNAFEIVMMSLKKWATDNNITNWHVISLGEPHANFYLNDYTMVESCGKVTLQEYANFMLESSIGISLMVSPHPSYPPLEMSTFGMKVITNSYGNKNLENFNNNIISLENPSPESIANKLQELVKNFNEHADYNINDNYIKSSDTIFDNICNEIISTFK